MPRSRASAGLAALAAAAALAACGSSGGSSSSSTASAPAASPTAATATSATSPTSAAAAPNGAQATRTATAPAYVTPGVSGSSGLAGATASVTSRGFAVVDPSVWEPEHTLTVLVGSRGSVQQAFFFAAGHYIGTDTAAPSRNIQVLHQESATITIGYNTARGLVPVRFHWTGVRLVALDPIPTVAARA